jgi:hypothetical protein
MPFLPPARLRPAAPAAQPPPPASLRHSRLGTGGACCGRGRRCRRVAGYTHADPLSRGADGGASVSSRWARLRWTKAATSGSTSRLRTLRGSSKTAPTGCARARARVRALDWPFTSSPRSSPDPSTPSLQPPYPRLNPHRHMLALMGHSLDRPTKDLQFYFAIPARSESSACALRTILAITIF